MKTARMSWDTPVEEQEDWFSIREKFDTDVDQAIYSLLEMKQTVLAGGGTVAWNSGTSTLTWSAVFEFLVLTTGRVATVAAGALTIANGEVVYADLSRPMLDNTTVTLSKASLLGTDLGRQFFAVRRGVKLYLANGLIL